MKGLKKALFPRWTLLLLVLVLFALLLAAGGCGRGKGVRTETTPLTEQLWPDQDPDGQPVPWRSGCAVLDGPSLPGGEFTVLLNESVDPAHAPVPHNPGERLVFAQLYETLVNVACDGRILPGLARHWACTEDSTVWVFTLRTDARLWDGTRITADLVRQAWAGSQECPRSGSQSSPWAWLNARSQSIKALDGLRLAVSLPEPQAQFPTLLAHPATAVAVKRPGWTWPVGSGPCRLRASTPTPLPTLETRPNPHHPRAPTWKSLTFLVHPGRDPRDLADQPFDLLLVRDQASRRFYDQVPGLQTLPLPWDRLYLLAVSPEQNPDGGATWRSAARKIDPARDLTSGEARSWPDLIFPSGPAVQCPQLTGPVATRPSAERSWDLPGYQLDAQAVVCTTGDPTARELAERLSALRGGQTRVAVMPADAASFSLQWQMAGAQVLRLDQIFPTRCLQKACLLSRAAWIQKAAHTSSDQAQGDTVLRRHLTPLALTRPWLVARPGLAGLRLDFDGTLLLDRLGRAAATTDEAMP